MSTSLQEQLKRLALPQTAQLSGGKRQTSILFDSKEAATKDRRSIFELGRSGLEQLINFNPSLKQFEATLFNEETIHLERSVENVEINNILNLNINKFFLHLSPYFMVRPAHLCIEWLIRRFHVHEYNRDALLKLALPYHETNIFVRIIQTFYIKDSDVEWNWLKPLQKPGVHLSKSVIINRATSSKAFFSFICKIITEAIDEFGKNVHILQQQINLYTNVMLGVLNNVAAIEEWHVTSIAHSLLAALRCDAVDYVSAAYMIAGFLTKRATLNKKLYKAFITCATNNKFESQDLSALALLILIYDVDEENEVPPLSKKNLDNLIKKTGSVNHLAELAAAKHRVGSLCKQLVTAACEGINTHDEDADKYKKFLNDLCMTVTLNNDESEVLISCILESYATASGVGGHINGFISDDNTGSNSIKKLNIDDMEWYSNIFMGLEAKYPLAYISFEANCKKYAKSIGSVAYGALLNYRFMSLGSGCDNISDRLVHPNEAVRIAAIRTLVANEKHLNLNEPKHQAILKNSLMRCIKNSNLSLFVEILHLPTEHCLKIFGLTDFLDLLIKMIDAIQRDPSLDESSWMLTVKHLTASALLENFDNNIILILLMTFLFPADGKRSYHSVIEVILTSDLSQKLPYLQDFFVHIESSKREQLECKWIRNSFIKCLSKAKVKPSVRSIMESAKEHKDRIWSNPLNISHLIVVLTGTINADLTNSDRMTLFDELLELCTYAEVKYFDVRKWNGSLKSHYIALTLMGDFCSLMVRQTDYSDLMNWAKMGTDLQLFLKIFSFLASQFLHQNAKGQTFLMNKLHDIISIALSTTPLQVQFMLNFCTHTKLPILDDYSSVRQIVISLLMFIIKSKTHLYTITKTDVIKMLVLLCDESKIMRINGIRMLKLVKDTGSLDSDWETLVKELLKREEAVCTDKEVCPLTIFSLLTKKKVQISSVKIYREILSLINSEEIFEKTPYLTLELLNIIKYLDVKEVVDEVISIGNKSLEKYESENVVNLLKEPFINIVDMAMLRYSEQTFVKYLCNQSTTWELFEKILNSVNTLCLKDGSLVPLPCIAIETFQDIYHKFPKKHKTNTMKAIVRTLSLCNDSSIFIMANEMLKNSEIDCKSLVDIISNMYKDISDPVRPGKRRQSTVKEQSNSPIFIQSPAWKEGVVFLELLEGKEQLLAPEVLIPGLFEVLRICLEFHMAVASDQTMRIALSVLLHCCQKCQSNNVDLNVVLPNSVFRIDLVVECVRSSSNKQTQHNALLLLAKCAHYFPQQVLHNIVNIFTFMGSSVVRQDDAYSLHVINNVIESIVPILVVDKTGKNKGKDQDLNPETIQVLKVFSDIMLDVPQHRRIPLYRKLMQTLGVSQYLWAYLCIAFEIQITDKLENGETKTSNVADKSKRMECLFELVYSFNVNDVLETCIELLHYLRNLPTSIEYTGLSEGNKPSTSNIEMTVFDTNCHTPKQLRHFIYLIVQFLSKLTSTTEFLTKIAMVDENEQERLKPVYKNLILKILSYIPIVQNQVDQSVEASVNKFWRVIQNHSHDILNNSISLLSSTIFLNVIEGLLVHQYLSVRRKVLELFITKLQLKETYFKNMQPEDFTNILRILSEIVENILHTEDPSMSPSGSTSTNSHSNQMVFVQQNALIVIKLLSQFISMHFLDEFKNILNNLLRIMKNRENVPKIILASSVLTVVELCSNINVHCLTYLPKFMEYLLEILRKQSDLVQNQPPDSIFLAIITGVQKLFESLFQFLGPYIKNIVIMLCLIVTRIEQQNLDMNARKTQRTKAVVDKVYTIFSVVGSHMPQRIVVPCCSDIYESLIEQKIYAGIVPLMKLLLQSINSAEPEALTAAQNGLKTLFLKAISFRLNFPTNDAETLKQISTYEDSIIETNVQWLLKLPESAFRPFFNKLHNWAFKLSGRKEALLTFFRLTNKLAETLKSLLVLFINDFMDDIADLLNKCNSNKQVLEPNSEPFCTELLVSILETLFQLFFHNSKNYVTSRRFEVLLQPISDQLDNDVVLNNEPLQQILSLTIAQFAAAVSNDLLWKQLNYQVLLKTRSNNSKVRIFAFNCCVEVARKLGPNFSTLLPDTVPFIAELLEDENSTVEKNTRQGVQELEGILGESLQQYIS